MHEERFKNNMLRLQKWRTALQQVANLSGWHFQTGDGYEYEFIGNIVEHVSTKMNRVPLPVADYPVGVEPRVLEINSLLDIGSSDEVNMIGIHGSGGIGKTTLALAVYNFIADHFEALCFLGNIREDSNKHGLQYLQKILLSGTLGEKKIELTSVKQGISIIKHRLQQKKILLVLDDVDKIEQLEALVGGSDWLGPGSRVIITTRDKHLLLRHMVNETYELKELNEKDAFQLLTWKAFKKEKFHPSYLDVLKRAVAYASGLPLALIVIGSNLFGKNIEEWKSALHRYEIIPNKEIQDILKGTSAIKTIYLMECDDEVELDESAFKKMKNLKTLIIRGGNFSKGPKYLPNSLRVVEWWRYPSEYFPDNFKPKKLAIFNLPRSSLTSLKLTDLLKLRCCGMIKLPSSIVTMPKLAEVVAWGSEGLQFLELEEGEDRVTSMVSSNVECLRLAFCNLSDAFLPITLKWFVNMKELYLSGNTFTILPECIKECHLLKDLRLDNCQHLQEVRGIAPNLEIFTAVGCKSWTSTEMLLNQELHEGGSTMFYLPGSRIPDWFEHCSNKGSISFWIRNKFPAIDLCLVPGSTFVKSTIYPMVIINGNECELDSRDADEYGDPFLEAEPDHTYILDLQKIKFEDNLDEALLEDRWNHVEIMYQGENNDRFLIDSGIHVLKQKSSTEDIRFTTP